MNKYLVRSIVSLLIPCLVVNPTSGSIFNSNSWKNPVVSVMVLQSPFRNQALSPLATFVRQNYSRKLFPRLPILVDWLSHLAWNGKTGDRQRQAKEIGEIVSIPHQKDRFAWLEEYILTANQTSRVEELLDGWLLTEAQRRIRFHPAYSGQDRVELISRCLSLALRRPDAAVIADHLENLLNDKRSLLPEAQILVPSYLSIWRLEAPTTAEVVMHLYHGHLAVLDPASDKDILGSRLMQLEELSQVNPYFRWHIRLVADGGWALKDAAQAFVRQRHPDHASAISVDEVNALTIAKLASVKAAPILYGFHQAVQNEAEFIVGVDFHGSPHLAQMGNLLRIAQANDRTIAVGSRRMRGSVIYKVWFRRLSSSIFNKWVWLQEPRLIGVTDTQTPLKLYPRSALQEILPFDDSGQFDHRFNYTPSFDASLMQRGVRLRWCFVETPSVDTLTMSARPKDHFVLTLSDAMARGVAEYSRMFTAFRGFFHRVAQGTEAFIIGHSSQDVLIKIPRYYKLHPLRTILEGLRAIATAQGDADTKSDRFDEVYKLQSTSGRLTQGPGIQAFFRFMFSQEPFRGFTLFCLSLAAGGRGTEFSRASLVKERMGGLVVPFAIYRDVEITVLPTFTIRAWRFLIFAMSWILSTLWRILMPARWLLRIGLCGCDPYIRWVFLHIVAPWAKPIFIWGWKRLEVSISWVYRVILRQAGQQLLKAFQWAERVIRHPVHFIAQLYRKASTAMHRWGDWAWNTFSMQVQRLLDRTGLAEWTRTHLWVFVPLETAVFSLLHKVGCLFQGLLERLPVSYEHIPLRDALMVQRVIPLGQVWPQLKHQHETTKALIDQYVGLQKALWRRGGFNRDLNILEDSGLDQGNHLLLLDFTEVVFSREEANQFLNQNKDFVPRFHFQLFQEMTSSEAYEYFMTQMRDLYHWFLSEEGQRAWGREPAIVVPDPPNLLRPDQLTCNTPLSQALTYWSLMVDHIAREYDIAAPPHQPVARQEANAALLEFQLTSGSPSQKKIAEQIVSRIGQQMSIDLLSRSEQSPTTMELGKIVRRLPRSTRKIANHLLCLGWISHEPAAWENSRTAFLLASAIKDGTKGNISLALPHRTFETPTDRGQSAGQPSLGLPVDSNQFVLYPLVMGMGSRMGLLAVRNRKSDIRVFGKRLRDYSRDFVWRFFEGDTPADHLGDGWVVLTAGDIVYPPPVSSDLVRETARLVREEGASLVYFDTRAVPQHSSALWWIARLSGVFRHASRHGVGLSAWLRDVGIRWNQQRHLSEAAGSDVPAILFLRAELAEQFFRCIPALNTGSSGLLESHQPLEFHRDLILPFKMDLPEWMLLWSPASGRNPEEWKAHWFEMQEVKRDAHPVGIVYDQAHRNIDTPRDAYTFYQLSVDLESPALRNDVRRTAGIPLNATRVSSSIKGAVTEEGQTLVIHSQILCDPGVELVLGDHVVIDHSDMIVTGAPGDRFFIPPRTVIANTRYRGPLARSPKGGGGFWYRVEHEGASPVPFKTDTVFTTIPGRDGKPATISLPMEFNPKAVDPETRKPFDESSFISLGNRSLSELRANTLKDAVLQEAEPRKIHSAVPTPNNEPQKNAFLHFVSWIIGVACLGGFLFFMVHYFFLPQFVSMGMTGTAGTDFIHYYLGPQVDAILGHHGAAYKLNAYQMVVRDSSFIIDHPNPAYKSLVLRSPEGFSSTPFALFLFRYTFSVLPFWVSLNLWTVFNIGLLVASALTMASIAANLSGAPARLHHYWKILSVSLLVFVFAPSLVGFGLGQVNSIVMILSVAGIKTYVYLAEKDRGQNASGGAEEHRMKWAGGPMALAAALWFKIFTWPFLLHLLATGVWNVFELRGGRKRGLIYWLKDTYGNMSIRYAIRTIGSIIILGAATLAADGVHPSYNWLLFSLPRTMRAMPVLAPADVPSLHVYLMFLQQSGIIGRGLGLQWLISILFGLQAILVSRASAVRNKNQAPWQRQLRLWLVISFWMMGGFTWSFIRNHYAVVLLLVYPVLAAAAMRLHSRGRRALITTLACISYIGFSHPIPYFLLYGKILNYATLPHYPVNFYNLFFGYPASLLLAGAILFTIRGLDGSGDDRGLQRIGQSA